MSSVSDVKDLVSLGLFGGTAYGAYKLYQKLRLPSGKDPLSAAMGIITGAEHKRYAKDFAKAAVEVEQKRFEQAPVLNLKLKKEYPMYKDDIDKIYTIYPYLLKISTAAHKESLDVGVRTGTTLPDMQYLLRSWIRKQKRGMNINQYLEFEKAVWRLNAAMVYYKIDALRYLMKKTIGGSFHTLAQMEQGMLTGAIMKSDFATVYDVGKNNPYFPLHKTFLNHVKTLAPSYYQRYLDKDAEATNTWLKRRKLEMEVASLKLGFIALESELPDTTVRLY